MKHARRDFMQMTLLYLPCTPFPPSFAGGRGVLSRYTQINSIFISLHSLPNFNWKRGLSWNDHCLIVVCRQFPTAKCFSLIRKKGTNFRDTRRSLDCLWREAAKRGGCNQARDSWACLHRISLSRLGLIFA
ncbi:hypothetical protein CEXT_679381 [Caerostris extrusa]|uniref:Secreted protein n=1 Tax=Caerostris extrusa TaxID=172846 RepID=A0AAV4SQB9_CAEEX|nr:hypothetical protein CEXT_679381 [Caerostris extrusa]